MAVAAEAGLACRRWSSPKLILSSKISGGGYCSGEARLLTLLAAPANYGAKMLVEEDYDSGVSLTLFYSCY